MANPFVIPLNALRAIEVVSRTHALGPAAEELGVTVGAVSQHIRRAEERLGLPLFERTANGLIPTAELRDIEPMLRSGFQSLSDAVGQLTGRDDHVLTVTVGSVFASRWLIWRVAKFSALYPDIELRLVVTGQMLDLARGDIDCGIRFGTGTWEGVDAEPVGGFTYRPVCAPPLARHLKTPRDIAKLPVIRDEASMLPWKAWWQKAGVTDPPKLHGPAYTDPSLAFDAAISEQGVLMAVDLMSADTVSDGRLVRPFDVTVTSDNGYFLVTGSGRRLPKKVALFRDWLAEEVPASTRGYVHQLQQPIVAPVKMFREGD